MPLGDILGTALSGLGASQAGLRAVANNIANAQSVGYARAKVEYAARVSGPVAGGVEAQEVQRVADRFLEAATTAAVGDASGARARAAYLTRVSELLGEPGRDAGLGGRLDALQAAAIDLASLARTGEGREAVVGRVGEVLEEVSRVARDIEGARADASDEASRSLDRINRLLLRIRDLNEEVVRSVALGRSVSGPADARAAAVAELASEIGLVSREAADGRLILETKGGQVLLDRRARQLEPVAAALGSATSDIAIAIVDPLTDLPLATTERFDAVGAGGAIGALTELRDRTLPGFGEELKLLGIGVATALNAASADATAVPPPAVVTGVNTGLAAADALRATGQLVVAALGSDGRVVGRTVIDLASVATIGDLAAAISAGLGGSGQADFIDGRLTLRAGAGAAGVAVAEMPGQPAMRAEVPLARSLGLNAVIDGRAGALTPSGLQATDLHRVGPGEAMRLVLRDSSGRAVTAATVEPAAVGATIGDVVAALNAGSLATQGAFALTPDGRVAFTPSAAFAGARIEVVADTTDRAGTGAALTDILDLGQGRASGVIGDLAISAAVRADPRRLPIGRLDPGAAIGSQGVPRADASAAARYLDALTGALPAGVNAAPGLDRLSARVLGSIGASAGAAKDVSVDAEARAEQAQRRRDAFSGVSIDEEMAQMVILQNAYAASARVLSIAREMSETLLTMVR